MLNKKPGETFTLTAVYSDKDGVNRPLASLPTCSEASGLATTPVGTPTVSDAQFQFSGTIPTDAAVGTNYVFNFSAEGDPTPGVDTIPGTYTIGVVAPEDSQVSITGA